MQPTDLCFCGYRVTAVTSSAAKAAFIQQLGADDVIVAEDLTNFHKRLSAAGKVDMVVDCVGGPTMNASLRSVKPGGSVVVLGNVENRFEKVDAECARPFSRSAQRVSFASGLHHLEFNTRLWF
jgi:NADPH:quinone reductase-like Zn-dependent oxidoreductase